MEQPNESKGGGRWRSESETPLRWSLWDTARSVTTPRKGFAQHLSLDRVALARQNRQFVNGGVVHAADRHSSDGSDAALRSARKLRNVGSTSPRKEVDTPHSNGSLVGNFVKRGLERMRRSPKSRNSIEEFPQLSNRASISSDSVASSRFSDGRKDDVPRDKRDSTSSHHRSSSPPRIRNDHRDECVPHVRHRARPREGSRRREAECPMSQYDKSSPRMSYHRPHGRTQAERVSRASPRSSSSRSPRSQSSHSSRSRSPPPVFSPPHQIKPDIPLRLPLTAKNMMLRGGDLSSPASSHFTAEFTPGSNSVPPLTIILSAPPSDGHPTPTKILLKLTPTDDIHVDDSKCLRSGDSGRDAFKMRRPSLQVQLFPSCANSDSDGSSPKRSEWSSEPVMTSLIELPPNGGTIDIRPTMDEEDFGAAGSGHNVELKTEECDNGTTKVFLPLGAVARELWGDDSPKRGSPTSSYPSFVIDGAGSNTPASIIISSPKSGFGSPSIRLLSPQHSDNPFSVFAELEDIPVIEASNTRTPPPATAQDDSPTDSPHKLQGSKKCKRESRRARKDSTKRRNSKKRGSKSKHRKSHDPEDKVTPLHSKTKKSKEPQTPPKPQVSPSAEPLGRTEVSAALAITLPSQLPQVEDCDPVVNPAPFGNTESSGDSEDFPYDGDEAPRRNRTRNLWFVDRCFGGEPCGDTASAASSSPQLEGIEPEPSVPNARVSSLTQRSLSRPSRRRTLLAFGTHERRRHLGDERSGPWETEQEPSPFAAFLARHSSSFDFQERDSLDPPRPRSGFVESLRSPWLCCVPNHDSVEASEHQIDALVVPPPGSRRDATWAWS